MLESEFKQHRTLGQTLIFTGEILQRMGQKLGRSKGKVTTELRQSKLDKITATHYPFTVDHSIADAIRLETQARIASQTKIKSI